MGHLQQTLGFSLIYVSASQSSHNVKQKKNPKTYGQIHIKNLVFLPPDITLEKWIWEENLS